MTCRLPVETFVHRLVRLGLGGGAGHSGLSQGNADGLLPGRLVRLWHRGAVEPLRRDVFQGLSVSWKCHIRQVREEPNILRLRGTTPPNLKLHYKPTICVQQLANCSHQILATQMGPLSSLSVCSAPRGHFFHGNQVESEVFRVSLLNFST